MGIKNLTNTKKHKKQKKCLAQFSTNQDIMNHQFSTAMNLSQSNMSATIFGEIQFTKKDNNQQDQELATSQDHKKDKLSKSRELHLVKFSAILVVLDLTGLARAMMTFS